VAEPGDLSLAGLSLTSLQVAFSPRDAFLTLPTGQMAYTMISWAIKTTQLNTLLTVRRRRRACQDCRRRPESTIVWNDLSNNNVEDDGCKSLADGLTANTGLSTFASQTTKYWCAGWALAHACSKETTRWNVWKHLSGTTRIVAFSRRASEQQS
jgi:hypothetical protein